MQSVTLAQARRLLLRGERAQPTYCRQKLLVVTNVGILHECGCLQFSCHELKLGYLQQTLLIPKEPDVAQQDKEGQQCWGRVADSKRLYSHILWRGRVELTLPPKNLLVRLLEVPLIDVYPVLDGDVYEEERSVAP
jgi:hypothetical protein